MDEAADSSGLFVWVGLIQVRSIDDPGKPPRLQPGGTLRTYVLADTRDVAMIKLVGGITNEEYELLELEWLEPVTPTGWPHSWDEDDMRHYELAASSGEVVFGEIDRWDPDEFRSSKEKAP